MIVPDDESGIEVDGTEIELLAGESHVFSLTVVNPNLYSTTYELGLSGSAAPWTDIDSPVINLPAKASQGIALRLDVPKGARDGIYFIDLELMGSDGSSSDERLLVTVLEDDAIDAPSGAFVFGDFSGSFGLAIIVILLIDIALLGVLIFRKYRR